MWRGTVVPAVSLAALVATAYGPSTDVETRCELRLDDGRRLRCRTPSGNGRHIIRLGTTGPNGNPYLPYRVISWSSAGSGHLADPACRGPGATR